MTIVKSSDFLFQTLTRALKFVELTMTIKSNYKLITMKYLNFLNFNNKYIVFTLSASKDQQLGA